MAGEWGEVFPLRVMSSYQRKVNGMWDSMEIKNDELDWVYTNTRETKGTLLVPHNAYNTQTMSTHLEVVDP